MRNFIAKIKAFFGVDGASRATRHLGKIEKISVSLNKAVEQIEREVADDWNTVAALRYEFETKEAASVNAIKSKQEVKDRTLRSAIRLSALVS